LVARSLSTEQAEEAAKNDLHVMSITVKAVKNELECTDVGLL
jgi:hypothetical protein